MKKVAENMKTLRQQNGLTQKQLGALCGKSAGQISSYECGKVDVPSEVVYALAEKTGCGIWFLMTGTEPQANPYDAQFRVYSEADRKTIVPILVSNGYDVGQHKQQRGTNGKSVDYYIHIIDRAENISSAR